MINLIYSYTVLPALILFSHILALFSKRIRKPLFLRYRIFRQLKEWIKEHFRENKKVIILHSSSMGEFEHVKPLISKIKENFQVSFIVTFFSPSGYENVQSFPGVDLFLYLPFDFSRTWEKFYRLTRAELLIISKHDVWPNQIKVAQKCGVKSILVNASLNENSSRNSFFARLMLAPAYNSLDKIFVVSEQDGQQFEYSFKCKNIQITGDTKFDQVVNRKKESIEKNLLDKNWLGKNFIVVLGSLWPQDAEHVLQAMPAILDTFKDLKVIVVPHQPTQEYINLFGQYLNPHTISLFSDNYTEADTRILIINKVGVLADIYKYGSVAYVGGSFKQGIHNVMEPAVYGLPVIYGPFHRNSFEARKLLKLGGSVLIHNSEEFSSAIKSFVTDSSKRQVVGDIAYDYVNRYSGGTEKILKYIHSILD